MEQWWVTPPLLSLRERLSNFSCHLQRQMLSSSNPQLVLDFHIRVQHQITTWVETPEQLSLLNSSFKITRLPTKIGNAWVDFETGVKGMYELLLDSRLDLRRSQSRNSTELQFFYPKYCNREMWGLPWRGRWFSGRYLHLWHLRSIVLFFFNHSPCT